MRSFKKVGIMFLALVFVLGGIGGAFAAWTDSISIEGTVETGSVGLSVEDYSGTAAWKVSDEENEITTTGLIKENEEWVFEVPDNRIIDEPIGTALARAGGAEEADVVFEFDNLFPCVDWCANFVIHNSGSIPVKLFADIDTNDEWLKDLWDRGYVTVSATWIASDDPEKVDQAVDITAPVQVHPCEQIMVVLCIYIPQELEMDLEGSFSAWIGAIQWNKAADAGNYFPPNND